MEDKHSLNRELDTHQILSLVAPPNLVKLRELFRWRKGGFNLPESLFHLANLDEPSLDKLNILHI